MRAPHWRRARGYTPAELSTRLGELMRQVGELGELGRAFSARHREDFSDPFSNALESTPAEQVSGLSRVIRIRTRDPSTAERLAHLLISTGLAESTHPVATLTTGDLEPDTLSQLPSMQPGGWAVRVIHGDEALDLEPGDPDVIVAVLDTGVDSSHPELHGKLVSGYDFVAIPDEDTNLIGDVKTPDPDTTDEAGHGTHVAGIIGARGKRMINGMGGDCRIMPVRVLGTTLENGARVGVGIITNIDDGLKYAVDRGADVINLSLGITASGPGIPHRRAVEYARLHDVIVVASSGNDGTSQPVFPGAVPGVITVGAITELGRVAAFSSWGPFLDVVAPGTAIYSADLGGGYRYRSGTSHAAPFVSGVAALIVARARRQWLTLRERTIRRIIRDTADRSDQRRADAWAGTGILNARDAILLTSNLIRNHLIRQRQQSWQDVSSAVLVLTA